jgi:hypothetical protein
LSIYGSTFCFSRSEARKLFEIQRYFSPEIEVISIGPEGKLCDLLVGSSFDSITAPGFENGGVLE